MYAVNNEHSHASISERWDALEEYFICISECDLGDHSCTTRCMVTHLHIDDGSDLELASSA